MRRESAGEWVRETLTSKRGMFGSEKQFHYFTILLFYFFPVLTKAHKSTEVCFIRYE